MLLVASLNPCTNDNILVKLDFSNAFNSLHRYCMLQAVSDIIPELHRYCHLAYSQSALLSFGQHTVMSQEGPQQDDPIGPLYLFALQSNRYFSLCRLN